MSLVLSGLTDITALLQLLRKNPVYLLYLVNTVSFPEGRMEQWAGIEVNE